MRRRSYLKLWLILLGLAGGCTSLTQAPSGSPLTLPAGDNLFSQAKLPGLGFLEAKAVRLDVIPLESTSPVQTHHVVIATVLDGEGKPRRRQRVEWMLEGAGNIIEVDGGGTLMNRGARVDNRYAVSYTDVVEHRITRGNDNAADDFTVQPGQTWCVISSASEGDTRLTVHAPEIDNWDANKVVVTHRWVDAEWRLPPAASHRAGAMQVLTTHVFRPSDRQPLANYRVRYRVLDGPPAVFLPLRTTEEVAVSDLSGTANVTLAQANPEAGVNRVSVEVIRAPDPTTPGAAGVVIARGETTVQWLAPQVGVSMTAPPAARLGQDVPFMIEVANTGQLETQEMTIRTPLPEGTEYVRSEPAAGVEGNQLVWTLGPLAAGGSHRMQVVVRPARLGAVTSLVSVVTREGLKAENRATTEVGQAQIDATMTGPANGVVGVPVTYPITVTNKGTSPATNVVVRDEFDKGLEHETGANPVEKPIGTLNAGESRTVAIALTPRQPGRFVNRVVVTADGNLSARAEHPVVVQAAQLALQVSGPARRYVSGEATWDIRVRNAGEVPLANVVLREQLPPEVSFVSASQGGTAGNGEVTWTLGALQPKDEKQVVLTVRCEQRTPRAVLVGTATADPGQQARQEAAVEVLGVPAFRLEVDDREDPVAVNGRTAYRILVTNQGTLPGSRIEVVAIVPEELRVLNAGGAAPAKVEPGQRPGEQRVVFDPVPSLAAGQVLAFTIDVQAVKPGDARFRAELRTATLRDPVADEESTSVYDPHGGHRPSSRP